MTMVSFRVDGSLAAQAQAWAERLGVDRSQLLRDALERHLLRLASERDAQIWLDRPRSSEEQALTAVEEWGPAEDWADWADAAR